MIRHQYSYWLRVEGSVDVRQRAHEWLRSHGTVPDFLQLVIPEEENVSNYEVPDGTIEETPDMWDAIDGLARDFPALSIYFDELDEEDHSIERHSYWHDGKHAVEHKEITNDMLRAKAENPELYQSLRFNERLESAVYLNLFVEGMQGERLKFSERLRDNPVLTPKEPLWKNLSLSFYAGCGSQDMIAEVVRDITAALSNPNSLIVFLEETHLDGTGSCWHCWNNGRHVHVDDSDSVLYESQLDLRDLLLDMCRKPELYFGHRDVIEDIPQPEKTAEETEKDNRLAGGYYLVKSIDLDDRDNEELPVLLAVKEDFLLSFAHEKGYGSLEEFYSKHTAKDVQDLEYQASYTRNMAFSFHTETGELAFPMLMKSDGVLAIIDFISGKLQENGFTDASKYLDCFFDL